MLWPTATVSIVTAPLWNSGTTGRVKIRIFGNKGSTAELDLLNFYCAETLNNGTQSAVETKAKGSSVGVPFQQGSSDTFKMPIHEIGQIGHIDVRLDCASASDSWSFDTITIQCDKGVRIMRKLKSAFQSNTPSKSNI
jgi:hypothetical protein